MCSGLSGNIPRWAGLSGNYTHSCQLSTHACHSAYGVRVPAAQLNTQDMEFVSLPAQLKVCMLATHRLLLGMPAAQYTGVTYEIYIGPDQSISARSSASFINSIQHSILSLWLALRLPMFRLLHFLRLLAMPLTSNLLHVRLSYPKWRGCRKIVQQPGTPTASKTKWTALNEYLIGQMEY